MYCKSKLEFILSQFFIYLFRRPGNSTFWNTIQIVLYKVVFAICQNLFFIESKKVHYSVYRTYRPLCTLPPPSPSNVDKIVIKWRKIAGDILMPIMAN